MNRQIRESKREDHGLARLTGGTGKLGLIRSTIAEINEFDNDPKTGYNCAESKGEYWF